MPSTISKMYSIRMKAAAGERKSRHAMEEFGPGRRGFIFCPHGEAVYYKKSWHHMSDFFADTPNFKREKRMRFRLCPVHELARNNQYEGEIIIRNVPKEFRGELRGLIEHMGARAMRLDVLDRILELRITDDRVRITTSENQLAQKIARKIAEVFKKHTYREISRAKESDVVRIRIDFISNE